ncbi:MAG: YeeE/YedE family protein, partial [Flavobacteriaceae bacterium]|nr:YeeE/YedE family protein [Flavobacteriaceae bacterium]
MLKKYFKFLAVGFFFGVLLVKSEIISWYRIFEMFNFQAFHMYGIIGSAIAIGMIGLIVFKKYKVNDINGNPINIPDKEHRFKAGIFGGAIFGLG